MSGIVFAHESRQRAAGVDLSPLGYDFPMNYQKLAETLLRVLGIWLLVQGCQQTAAAIFVFVMMSNRTPSISVSLWTSPIGAGLTLVLAVVLLFGSARISKLVATET